MAEITCVVCGETKSGIGKVTLSDGFICTKCAVRTLGWRPPMDKYQTVSTAQVKSLLDNRAIYSATKTYGPGFSVDTPHKLFCAQDWIFKFESLSGYELQEDGETVTKGGLGRAVVGGVLFGGVGAVVGAVTGGKKTKKVCASMGLHLSLTDAPFRPFSIEIIQKAIPTRSSKYSDAQELAKQYISGLEEIIAACRTESEASGVLSGADEIRKLKGLADEGIITQEEFEQKKKQILGL